MLAFHGFGADTVDIDGSSPFSFAAGLYPITCDVSGLSAGNYTFAQSGSTVNFAVNAKQLTVTPGAGQHKTYGSAEPTLTYTITGYANSENASTAHVSGTAVCSASTTLTSAAGLYPIACDVSGLSAGNYTFAQSGSTVNFTVDQKHLTVTADGKSMTYGDSVPGLTATISGLVNGENATSAGVSGAAHLSTAATSSTWSGQLRDHGGRRRHAECSQLRLPGSELRKRFAGDHACKSHSYRQQR